MPFLEFDGKILTESKAIFCYVAKELSKYIIQVDSACASGHCDVVFTIISVSLQMLQLALKPITFSASVALLVARCKIIPQGCG